MSGRHSDHKSVAESAEPLPVTSGLSVARARQILTLTAVGVCTYVGSWAVSGMLIQGYDPTTQAISETFAIGAPAVTRVIMSIALVTTGALLVAFGPALDRLAPGSGRLAVWTTAVSGVATMLIVAAPCTSGCSGFGVTTTDSAHSILAAIGYLALIATPLAVAWRVRHDDPTLAGLSWAFGLGALSLFIVANTMDLGVQGLLQRAYNTVADAWYVIAGLRILMTTR